MSNSVDNMTSRYGRFLEKLYMLSNYATYDYYRCSKGLTSSIANLCRLASKDTVQNNQVDIINSLLSLGYVDNNDNFYPYERPIISDNNKVCTVFSKHTEDYVINCGYVKGHNNDSYITAYYNAATDTYKISGKTVTDTRVFIHKDIDDYRFNGKVIPEAIRNVIKYLTCGVIAWCLPGTKDIEAMFMVPISHEAGVILSEALDGTIAAVLNASVSTCNYKANNPDNTQEVINRAHEVAVDAIHICAQNYGYVASIRYNKDLVRKGADYDDSQDIW